MKSDPTNSTIVFYDRNAPRYFEATVGVDMSAARTRFARYLPPGARILDAGSGSGRDTLAFLKLGYEVEAFDASKELAALSTKLTGIQTRVASFEQLREVERYDGIWACGSLLHVPRSQLAGVLEKCRRALKSSGALFASFREGGGDYPDADGRHYTDLTESALRVIVEAVPGLALRECWRTEDKNSSGVVIGWVNSIAVRVS